MPSSNATLSFAEHRLWSRLSGDQVDGLAFQRKAIVGPHVADFFCLDAKLAIEVDGPVTTAEAETEFARERYFERLGLRVLRFTEGQVLEDLEWVLGAIRLAVTQVEERDAGSVGRRYRE